MMEAGYQNAVEEAAINLGRQHKLKIEVKWYNAKQLREGAPAWDDLENDLKDCDFFLANMIANNEQVLPLEKLLKKYMALRPQLPVVVLNSMNSLMLLTRMGNFEFQKLLHFMKSGAMAKVTGFASSVGKLFRRDAKAEAKIEALDADRDEDEANQPKKLKARKPPKKGVHSGMVGMMRTLPAVLKLIPGQAQDLRAYILIMLYWLNGTPENLEHFYLFVIDKYLPQVKLPKVKIKEPVIYPRLALFHPLAGEKTFETRQDFDNWLVKTHPQAKTRPRVGLIVMRALYLAGNRNHLHALIKELDNLGVEAVPCYAAGLDFRPAIEEFFLDVDKKGKVTPTVSLVINMSGFALVGGAAENDAAAAIAQLQRVNVPSWSVIPLFFQSEDEWRISKTGLSPLQAAFQISVPELDGALEPRVYAAGAERGPDKLFYPLPDEVRRIARRAARFVQLSQKPNKAKKISVVLFSFPPDKGNVGTAAYLSVFESLFRLMQRLKQEGYDIELPKDSEELRQMVVEGNTNTYGTSANLHTHLATADYQRLFPAWTEIEPLWGAPPGNLLSDHQGLQILGRQFGNLLVAVQPTFGYEDDPMRLLMATNASPHHGFAAFYTYLDKVYQADAVLHFGTHGAMEFMPGKQIGLSARCWSDRLIADLPNFYLYSVNNPSEGTIAKRRGFATLISYLSPPMESAGLYQNFIQLKDLINLYRKQVAEGFDFKSSLANRQIAFGAADSGIPDNNAFSALIDSIADLARTVELKSKFDAYENPDNYVIDLYNQLLEVEERLIPSGLHIVDEPPDLAGLTDMLNSIASFDRGKPGSDEEARALTALIAEGLGWNIEELRKNARKDNDSLARWERLTRIQRHAVDLFIEGLLQNNPPQGKHTAAKYLLDEAKVSFAASENMFDYLVEVAEALRHNTEIQQIIRAFNGEYIEPSSGNDIVRNPAVLPTGRNIHALDPSLVPSPVARRLGEKSCKAVLERARQEMNLPEGHYPETIAMVLWGTDNIKTDGEGVAQALYLMGARAIADGMGKVSGVKLLPLSELGRPRIDVVCTVSGIFRDLMPNQMELLDRAARLAAQANEPYEMNFIKKHVDEEMAKGVSFEEAAARVFSNAPGNYGANVNFMVDSGSWESEDELAEAFLTRKGFAFGVKAQGEEARKLMESALSRVQLSFQNVDSAEIGITDVDHYFEYLGGISKTVEKLNGGKRPPALLADSLSATSGGLGQGNNIRTIEEMVRLESRTKLLNPKWYEGMLKFGYEGVREIEVRVTNTYGWSATAKAVDNWVYDGIDQTFVQNDELRQRMIELNPYSFKGIIGRLLEANGRGYWEADGDTIDRLKELYAGLEDEIEGIGGSKLATNPNARVTG